MQVREVDLRDSERTCSYLSMFFFVISRLTKSGPCTSCQYLKKSVLDMPSFFAINAMTRTRSVRTGGIVVAEAMCMIVDAGVPVK